MGSGGNSPDVNWVPFSHWRDFGIPFSANSIFHLLSDGSGWEVVKLIKKWELRIVVETMRNQDCCTLSRSTLTVCHGLEGISDGIMGSFCWELWYFWQALHEFTRFSVSLYMPSQWTQDLARSLHFSAPKSPLWIFCKMLPLKNSGTISFQEVSAHLLLICHLVRANFPHSIGPTSYNLLR